ncbi:MAG: 3-hydroxyacyl-CoA dehydrogenase/enoyl-CoA hydratase family protein [Proteobacteria bacterium]|nr:3-hydroxyacyl-CoA dehydrogenase/enoyl-CoA hydratase family protein [Pseudomonadota bacterium]
MIVGVIGSGAIGPDLAYGFISAIAREPGSKVYLHDINPEALEAGTKRIMGYVKKGLARGKINPKVAKGIEQAVVPTLDLNDFADCDYVLEAASEDLAIKKIILTNLEKVVRDDCLIGFATSGIPRRQIAAEAQHPNRCFVNHPFFPAWRTLPIEIVPSEDEELSAKMVQVMRHLGKVPILTSDVECFAADDVFCNYISEAVRIVEEGIANPAQVDKIINDAIGGGGPLNVMDLTGGNLLVVHCQELMRDADTGSAWFEPPALLHEQGGKSWHDRKNPLDASYDEATGKVVLDRMLAVLMARTYFVADNGICEPGAWDWLSRMALGFSKGLLSMAEDLGADKVHDLCVAYAADHPGFEVPKSIQDKNLLDFYRNVVLTHDDEIAVVTICRPEVKNALSALTIAELDQIFDIVAIDDDVKGVVLTSFDGSLAGADIGELAALETPDECEALCNRAHPILAKLGQMDKPTVAALDGPVLGGGAELSMCCDARVVGHQLMMGQPEVNLGIIPGYGGTQRLPRLIGLERALDLLRTGRPIFAKHACAWGWATGEPADDAVATAKALIRQHLAGETEIKALDSSPMAVPEELPKVAIGQHSLAIDAILVDVVKRGLPMPLVEGLMLEAEGFARCKRTKDLNIGMSNFMQNGPRVPAEFLHE